MEKKCVRYRTERFQGSGIRDAVEVMTFEIFELRNADILLTLKNGILRNNSISKKFNAVIEDLEGGDECPYNTEKKQKRFCEEILREINKETECDIKYALWLADKDTVKEYYGTYIESKSDIDAYEVSPVILSELGYDGTLYGYENYPVALE